MLKARRPSTAIACAAAVSIAALSAGAAGPADSRIYPKAAFTFDDSGAYDLRSDGRGTYAHAAKDGYGGTIDAEFTVSGTQANVNLNLVKSGRKFMGAYRYESPGNSCASPCAPLADGSFTDGWFLTIYGLPALNDGETRLVQALFTRGGASTLSKYAYPRFTSFWCGVLAGSNACPSARQGSGSGMVLVTRQDVNHVATWTAVAAFDANSPEADDLSEIVEQTGSTTSASRGLYHSSFRIVVQCIAGCGGLPYPPL